MKKLIIFIASLGLFALLFTACEPEPESFEESLLIGKWKLERAGDTDGKHMYERYNANGSGSTWDEAEDVLESEAQFFTWTLDQADLTQIHIMEIGGNVPKYYTVTELSGSTLIYRDDFGKRFTFTRVSD